MLIDFWGLRVELPEQFKNLPGVAAILGQAKWQDRNMEVEPRDPEAVREWTDPFGTVWRGLGGYTSGDVIRPGLPTWDDWGDYEFPATLSDEDAEAVSQTLSDGL